MKQIVFFHFILLISIELTAQTNNISITQKLNLHAAISDNIVDGSAILCNQAAGHKIQGLHYGILAEKKFLINELNQLVFFGSKNYGNNRITIIQDYNGFAESYCMQTSIGFTKFISDNTSLGLKFNYLIRHIKSIRNSKIIGGDISLIQRLTKNFQTGLIVINPQNFFSKKNSELADNQSCYKWGLLYDVSKQFYVFMDMINKEKEQLGIVSGFAFKFNDKVDVMYSFSLQEVSNSFCIGFKLNKMKIKLMNSFHPQLGYSPSIMLLSNLDDKHIN